MEEVTAFAALVLAVIGLWFWRKARHERRQRTDAAKRRIERMRGYR